VVGGGLVLDTAVGPMNPNQAAAQALKLAFGNEHVCPPQIQTPHLSIHKMRELVVNAKQSADYTPIIRTFGSVFSEPEYLNVSFLKVRLSASRRRQSSAMFHVARACALLLLQSLQLSRCQCQGVAR
jgi:hypothetical protein